MAFDIYKTITERILEELDKGIIPWEKPWTGVRTGAISHSTGRAYSLLNQMLLGKPGEYITFNQCTEEGGKVRKGAKSKMVVFWKWIIQPKKDKDGKPLTGKDGQALVDNIPYLRYFNVFHLEDCEGIAAKYAKEDALPGADAQPIEAAETVLGGYVTRAQVAFELERGNRAYYSPRRDKIVLPLREQFPEQEEFYSTAYHEAVHSTGHTSRLARFNEQEALAAFGSEDYSKEELVAEIGAATIMNEVGIETRRSFRNTAAYIQSWARQLKGDPKMIVSAAGKAEKAAKMILGITE